jgi:predicted double-glycine peptidase
MVQTGLPFRRHLTVAAVVVAGLTTLVSAAAAAESDGRRAVRSLLEMRREKVVVQDWDLSCGAAVLATLLTYQHGDPSPPSSCQSAPTAMTTSSCFAASGVSGSLLADPAWGNRTMPVARFESAWLDSPEFGKVGFVVKRRDGRSRRTNLPRNRTIS